MIMHRLGSKLHTIVSLASLQGCSCRARCRGASNESSVASAKICRRPPQASPALCQQKSLTEAVRCIIILAIDKWSIDQGLVLLSVCDPVTDVQQSYMLDNSGVNSTSCGLSGRLGGTSQAC